MNETASNKSPAFPTSTGDGAGQEAAHQWLENHQQSPWPWCLATSVTGGTAHFHSPPALEGEQPRGTLPAPSKMQNTGMPTAPQQGFQECCIYQRNTILKFRTHVSRNGAQLNDYLITRVRNKVNKYSTDLSSPSEWEEVSCTHVSHTQLIGSIYKTDASHSPQKGVHTHTHRKDPPL